MKVSRQIALLSRLAVCVLLLGYLTRSMDISQLAEAIQGSWTRWPWLAAGVALTFCGLCAGALRWRMILSAQDIRLPFHTVFRTYFIGQFFNAFMLGACGGDVARAYYATRDRPDRKAEAASTVFVDRALGLFTMILVGCGIILIRHRLFLHNPGNRVPGILMFVFLGGAIVSMVALFRRNLFEHFSLFRRIEQNTRLGGLIRRSYEAFYVYRHKPEVLLASLPYSLTNLLCLGLACWSFGRSLGIMIPVSDVLSLFPIITVIAAIPVTPGSLGVREGLFAGMFHTLGVDPAYSVSMSLLVYTGGLVWSAFGGLLFLAHSVETGHGLKEELDALKHEAKPLGGTPIPGR